MTPPGPTDASESPPSPNGSVSRAPSPQDLLAAVGDSIRDRYAAYFDTVEDRLDSLRSALRQAQTRHETIRRDLSLDDSLSQTRDASPTTPSRQSWADSDGWHDLWTAVCTYRRRLREEVLVPLRTELADRPLGTVLVEERITLVNRLAELTAEQPVQVTRPEPDEFYAVRPGDGWGVRLRKRLVRARRRARTIFGVEASDPPSHTVPVRALVRHYEAALVDRHRTVLDAVEDRLLGWLARLERVLTSTTHTLLEFEQRTDHLDFHDTQADVEVAASPRDRAPTLAASLEEPLTPPSSDALASLQREIASLDEVLAAGISLSVDDLRATARSHLGDLMSALRDDAAQPWPTPAPPEEPPEARRRGWPAWDRQARARLQLCETKLAFYADVEATRDALIRDLLDEGPSPFQERLDALEEQLETHDDELRQVLSTAPDRGELSPSTLDAPLNDALAAVEERLDELREWPLGKRLRATLQSALDALRDRVDTLPEEVRVHDLPAPDTAPDPSAPEHAVPVRAGAEVTFDVLFFDRLREASQHLTDVLDEETNELTQVLDVLEFARDSARDDAPATPSAPLPSVPETDAFDSAREETDALLRGSLQRSTRLLQARRARVDAAGSQWANTVWDAFGDGMSRLHEQWSTESRFHSHVARLTRQVTREAQDAAADAQAQVQYGHLQARDWLRRGSRWLEAGWTAAWSALGLSVADEGEVRESVETIAALGDSLNELPIVYRRLFSFDPVEDPDLFKGREEEQAFVKRYVGRWKRGIPSSLLLVGDRGSGLTSLLKVVRATTLREANLHHLPLDHRPEDEEQLAAQVARALGLDAARDNRALTLDDVSRILRQDPPSPSAPVRACFVEHLEQLLLRTVGGLDLLDRMLTLISRTDAHVLWIGTMSTAAWQLVEKRLPAAAELVTHRHLDPLDRDALEATIMSRHHRSGLDLHFDPLAASASLNTPQTQEERRAAFFDRLYDLSHQNAALALLYWFRSVEPRDDGMGLRVDALQPISFRVLDELTLKQSFALKEFLFHSSLTVEEYSRVAQISLADSIDVIESLGNASLIEPVEGHSRHALDVYFEAVNRDVPYRIRPLLIAPIVQHLKAHNIVH